MRVNMCQIVMSGKEETEVWGATPWGEKIGSPQVLVFILFLCTEHAASLCNRISALIYLPQHKSAQDKDI